MPPSFHLKISDPAQLTVTEIFSTITHKRLWDYSDYSPIDEICNEYGKEDEEFQGWIQKYKADLAGFKATTKIIDYIEELDSIADPEESIMQHRGVYDKNYRNKLTMKLHSKITDKSLEYIDSFWRSVADHFLLPSLPVHLESIRRGCTEITWLVPIQAASKIESTLRSITFLQQFQVSKVTLDDRVLYAAEIDEVSNYWL